MNNKLHLNALTITFKMLVATLLLGSPDIAWAQVNSSKINIGLVYPLSTNGSNALRDTNHFSLNAIAGTSAAETGVTVAGVTSVVQQNATGTQIAGFSNHIGKKAKGVTLAGFANTYGSSEGFSAAGFGNFAKTSSQIQMAGFINIGGDVSAFESAGFINVAKSMHGMQMAGFANVAKRVEGFQLAGFINAAKTVKGVQMSGFINIADSADVQIGLFNISRNGEMAVAATIDEGETTLLSLRSGGKVMYGILGVGYNFHNDKQVYAYQAGLGAHIVRTDIFRLNTELTTTSLLNFEGGEYYKGAFAILPELKIGPYLSLFGGPSLNYINTDSSEGQTLVKKYISSWGGNNGSSFQGFYWGYTAGAAFRF